MCESVKLFHLWQVRIDLNALINSAAIYFLVRASIISGFCSWIAFRSVFSCSTTGAATVLVLVSIRLHGL